MAVSIGIEIGPTVVRAARVERAGGQARLLTVEEQPYDASQADGLGRALTQVRHSLRIAQPVVVGLPAVSAIVSTLHPLLVNRERAALAVQFELQQQLPFDLSQAAWHYQWLSNGGGPNAGAGGRAAAVAAVVKQGFLEERLGLCRRAGLSVAAVSINAVALLNACLLQRSLLRAKALTLLHLLDATSGEWVVWSSLGVQVIPVSSASPELLAQELSASWEGIRAQWPDASPSVWVAGAGESPQGLSAVQGQPFDPAQVVGMRTGQPQAVQRAAAAIGLALQGVGLARLPLNLLDRAQRARAQQGARRAALAISAVCAIAMVACGVTGMLEVRQRRLQLLNALEGRERLYQQLRPEVRTLLQRQQRAERLTAQLERLVSASTALTQTIAQVVQALPEAMWLTKVECAKGAAMDVTLEGRASSFQEVKQFLDRVKEINGVTAVKLLSNNVVPAPVVAGSGPGPAGADARELVTFTVQLQRSLGP